MFGLPKIQRSGNKQTVKVHVPQSPPTIRREVDPMKGLFNPRHVHVKLPKHMKVGDYDDE